MKKTLFALSLLAMSFSVFSQTDSIVLADYELNSQYPDRTSGWNDNLGLTIGVDNPVKDAINPSDKVISMHLTNQWAHAIVLDNFEPISLALYPNFKLKVLSDSAVSKKVGINLIDINGYAVYLEATLPADVNTKWSEVSLDFSSMVTSTPISFIKTVEIYIDRGTGDPAVGNMHNTYFVDDIEFKGPALTVTESDILPVYTETFSNNGWWGTGGGAPMMNTIQYFRSAQYGGSALSALEKFYTLTDSLSMAMDGWSGNTSAYFYPHATRPALSQLTIKNLSIEGLQNLKFSYSMNWASAPTSWTDALTVEYSADGTTWTPVTTSSTLPTATGTWATDITHNLTGVTAKNILVRITNNTTGNVLVDEIKLTGTPVFADSVVVAGTGNASDITTDNGTLQMLDTVSPVNASQNVIWSVENGTGKAEISSTGLLSALINGTVTVKARATDIWGTKVGEKVVTLSNQIYYVDSIAIKGKGDVYTINQSGDSLDIVTEVLPDAAHHKDINLSLKPVGDVTAAIFENGKLYAVHDGQVYIVAEATDGSGRKDSALFTITNQVPLIGIAFDKDVDSIKTVSGSLKLNVIFDPDTASNKTLTYSIISEGGNAIASVGINGTVSAKTNGTVQVRVVSKSNASLADTIKIVIVNQPIWKTFELATKVDVKYIKDTLDYSVKGKIGWDSKSIYLHFDVLDDSIYADNDTSSFNRDNFEIYFDMNNAKTPAWPRGTAIWPTSYNGQPGCFQLRLIPGIPFDSVNTGYKGYGIQNYLRTSTGYKYDLKVSIDSLLKGYVPEVGKEIGFDVLGSDNDNDPYYRDQMSWHSQLGTIWCDAAMWGTIKFANNGGFDVVYDTIKPTAITNLVTKQDSKKVLLTWDAASDNIVVDKYVIYVNDVKDTTIYAQKSGNAYLIDGLTTTVDYTFSVVAMDIEGNMSDKVNTSFTFVGVDKTEMSKLKIYPNPSTSFISLNNNTRVNLEVYNATGQIVILKSVNAGEKVDISALRSGVYMVRIAESKNASVLKLIKK